MNKKCLKCIMELIFIFILPLLIILASISCTKAMTYDENGNQLTEEKNIEYNNVILNEGSGNYINKLTISEKFLNNTPIYQDTNAWNNYNTNRINIVNNGDYIRLGLASLTNNSNNFVNKISQVELINNHKYLYKLKYQTTNSNMYNQIIKNSGQATILETKTLDSTGIYDFGFYILFFTMNEDAYLTSKFYYDDGTTNTTKKYFDVYTIELIDLTEMFGSGYEPTTIQDYNTYVNNQVFNYSQNGEVIEYIGSSQISENAEEDLTIWGKLKNLIIENLQLTDNIIIDIILSYTIIWFIMFIIWHFFYLFFDGITHLFIDWADRNKR